MRVNSETDHCTLSRWRLLNWTDKGGIPSDAGWSVLIYYIVAVSEISTVHKTHKLDCGVSFENDDATQMDRGRVREEILFCYVGLRYPGEFPFDFPSTQTKREQGKCFGIRLLSLASHR